MNRKIFIRQCTKACAGLALSSWILEACKSPMITAEERDNQLVLKTDVFTQNGKEIKAVMAYHEGKKMPVLLVKDETVRAYMALCTHQGAELQLMGQRLYCPAHGSEFDISGNVKQGPAQLPLVELKVTLNNNEITVIL